MNRRAVVFGSAGQLGAELVRELRARDYAAMGWDRDEVDITDAAAVENALARFDAEVVFNAAAYNQVDVAEEEPQAAFQVNALAVRNIALACRQMDARLVHFSTDYVFDGLARHPYAEDDPTHPLGAYAVSKLAGELYAQAYLDRALMVRTSGVFGPGGLATARGNFVELMLRLAGRGNRSGWWKTTWRRRRSPRCWRRAPSTWWTGGRRAYSTSAAGRRSRGFSLRERSSRWRARSRCCWPPTSGNTAHGRGGRSIRRCRTPRWNG